MCGVFGAALPRGSGTEAANIAALGLFSLQHRGQESAGLAVSDGAELFLYKDLGMISTVLDERRLPSFRGDLAIAHCRYSTTGSTIWENAQPTLRLGPRRAVAIGHNGNLVNTRTSQATPQMGNIALTPGTCRSSSTQPIVSGLPAPRPALPSRGLSRARGPRCGGGRRRRHRWDRRPVTRALRRRRSRQLRPGP